MVFLVWIKCEMWEMAKKVAWSVSSCKPNKTTSPPSAMTASTPLAVGQRATAPGQHPVPEESVAAACCVVRRFQVGRELHAEQDLHPGWRWVPQSQELDATLYLVVSGINLDVMKNI